MELAKLGQSVTYIFLGGEEKTEAVMSLATKMHMSKHSSITVLSQQDLELRFGQRHPWRPLPSPLSLVKLYIKEEHPNNLMVDEVPLETTWWRELVTFIMRKVLNVGIQKSTAFSLFFFIPVSLIFLIPFNFSYLSFEIWAIFWIGVLSLPWLHLGANVNEHVVFLISSICIALFICALFYVVSVVPEIRPLLILLALLGVWLVAGIITSRRFDLSATSNILLSLSERLPSESHLWIALHSAPLTDNVRGQLKNVKKEEVEDFRTALSSKFCCPSLCHNLRNSEIVANTLIKTWSGMTQGSKALPRANPPPTPPYLTSGAKFKPLFLPLSSPNQLGQAILHALCSLGQPGAFVILLDKMSLLEIVELGLKQEGISVTRYSRAEDSRQCEKYLSNPTGALITTGVLFSGMEASSIIWVTGDNSVMVKSNKQRAIERIVVINTDMRDCATEFYNMKIDGKFAVCHSPWSSRAYKCQKCPNQPILCPSCSTVCHPDCNCLWVVACFLFQFLLPSFCSYNPCSCASSGNCKLKTRKQDV